MSLKFVLKGLYKSRKGKLMNKLNVKNKLPFFLIILEVFLIWNFAKPETVKANSSNQPDEIEIQNLISKMPLEEKIGQLFISRTPNNPEQARFDAQKYHLGGYIIYGSDLQNQTASSFKTKIDSFQNSSNLPLLIAVDQEGGKVSRLSTLWPDQAFPSPQDIYQKRGIDGTLEEAKRVGQLLKSLGINWNYAPVADSTSDQNSFIYSRTLGANYETTSDYIRRVIPAWQSTGVAATLKHFPGYGAAKDTHTAFATVQKSKSDLLSQDLLPFESGLQAGVDSVMITHVIYENLDPLYPSSLSKIIITDLLRNQLKFSGVIVTDALEMGAISDFVKDHAGVSADLMALTAGNDMIMNNDYATAIPLIKQQVQMGKISEKEINDHVYRILKLKAKLNLFNQNHQVNAVTVSTIKYTNDNHAVIRGQVLSNDKTKGSNIHILAQNNQEVGSCQITSNDGTFQVKVPLFSQNQKLTLTSSIQTIAPTTTMISSKEEVAQFETIKVSSLSYQGSDVIIKGQITYQNAKVKLLGEQLLASDEEGNIIGQTVIGQNNQFTLTLPHNFQSFKVALSTAIAGVKMSQPLVISPQSNNSTMVVQYRVQQRPYSILIWQKDSHDKMIPSNPRKYLVDGTKVKVQKTQNFGNQVFALVDNNQWVEKKYLVFEKDYQPSIVKIGKVNYIPGYYVYLRNEQGKRMNQKVKAGSEWRVFDKKTINNELYYCLGNMQQWIQAKYLIIKK